MADQANAPAAPTPPPSAPQPDTPNAQPAPSNIPVGLALDLPGRFGAGWTVSGVDPSGNAILTKPSGDTMTSLTVSAQTLDRARQLRWNRARKPGKQKLTKRSFQFGGIRSDVAAYDAHSDRYLMQVQDAEGRTVTKWVASKDAEKLNNKDIEQAADEFASSLGLKTEKELRKKPSQKESKPSAESPTPTPAPASPKATSKTNPETIDQAVASEETKEKTEKANDAVASSQEIPETPAPIPPATERSAPREPQLQKPAPLPQTPPSSADLEAKTAEATDLEIPKKLGDIDPFLRDSAHAGDEQAAKLLTRLKSLQALQEAPTVEATFAKITKGTSVENLRRQPAANDPLRREYNRYQDLAKQIYEAHRTRIRDTEDVSLQTEEFAKAAARDGKTVDQVIKEQEFDRYYSTAEQEATERQSAGPEAIGAGLAAGAAIGVAGAVAANPIPPSLTVRSGPDLSQAIPSVSEIAAGLVGGGRTSRRTAPISTTSTTSTTTRRGSVSARGGVDLTRELTSQRATGGQISADINVSGGLTTRTTTNLDAQAVGTVQQDGTAQVNATVQIQPPTPTRASSTQPTSVQATVELLRAQNADRYAVPPPVGTVGKAAGLAFAAAAAPLLALGGRPSPSLGGVTPTGGNTTTTSRVRTTLPTVPAPQQLRVEQYVRSSDTLVQRQRQLTELEERNAPILDEYDTLIALPGRSPEQESRLQQLLAEHGDNVLRPRELLRNQIRASEDNLSSLTNAGARDGFDIPALAAPFLPGAQAAPSAATAETAPPPVPLAPKPVGKAIGIPSAVRPRNAPGSRSTPRGPGNFARAAAAGLSLLGGDAGSRASNEAAYTSELAQNQQRDRVGGDTRESVLGAEGGSGSSPIETIPQTYGAEPKGEKSERQRQSDMMATQRQLTGGLPQQAGDKIQLGGITIERKADNAADAYRRLREESQRDRQARSRGISASTGVRPRGVSPQAGKALGATGAVGSALASSGAVDTEALKKQVRRTKWELLLSVEGAPVYMLIGIGQFFGKMFLGKYLPEELKSEWWEDALCGLLILITFELIIMLCMLCFALLSGFAAFINPEQWARAIGGGLSNAVTSVGRAVGL